MQLFSRDGNKLNFLLDDLVCIMMGYFNYLSYFEPLYSSVKRGTMTSHDATEWPFNTICIS